MEPQGVAEFDIKPHEQLPTEILPRPENPDLRRRQELVLKNLEERGYLQIKRNIDRTLDHVVVNTQKFTEPGMKSLLKNAASTIMINEGEHNVSQTLYWTFKGIPVIDTQDTSDRPRNMFYVPSEKDVFKPSSIADSRANHYLALWDVGGHASNWNKPHPTREQDYQNKQIEMIDIAVPYMIYAQGQGFRDSDGKLWVNKDIYMPNAGRQRFSANWLHKNFGTNGPTESRWDENPRGLIAAHGEWEANHLLTVEDIPQKNTRRTTQQVSEKGYLTVGNRVFSLGIGLAGLTAEKVSANQYLVHTPEGDQIFTAQVIPEHLRECQTVRADVENYERVVTYVPQGAFEATWNEGKDRFYVYRYEGGKSTRTSVSISGEAHSLRLFQEGLPQGISDELFDLDIKTQIAVSKAAEEFPQAKDFIINYGQKAMVALADGYLEGGIDTRMFGLMVMPEASQILEKYIQLREATGRMSDSLNKDSVVGQAGSMYLERARQAMQHRAQDFLVLAAVDNVAESMGYMDWYLSAMNSISQAVTEEGININYSPAKDENGKTIGMTASYKFSDGRILSITTRPHRIYGDPKYAGQARLGISFRAANGMKDNIRIDRDLNGVSVDIGSHNSALSQAWTRVGKTHYTYAPFDKALDSEQNFARFIDSIPTVLNWKAPAA